MNPLGMAPWLDDVDFQRWKVLIEVYLQARGLNVWRLMSDGTRHDNHKERQYDIIAKSIILSFLCENVFNCVFA